MSKPSKRKNGKVPKITEAEYMAYLSSLKNAQSATPLNAHTEQPSVKDTTNITIE